jgi:RES domain-containing protein
MAAADMNHPVRTSESIGAPDGEYTKLDNQGGRLIPGRWNTPASPMLYTSEHYSTALLEKLVHWNSVLPANQHYVRITIPNGTAYDVFDPARHPGWDGRSESICKAVGEEWYASGRSAVLMVPSIPARLDRNFLINLSHAEARGIAHDLAVPVWWDERLFGRG